MNIELLEEEQKSLESFNEMLQKSEGGGTIPTKDERNNNFGDYTYFSLLLFFSFKARMVYKVCSVEIMLDLRMPVKCLCFFAIFPSKF